MIRFILDKNLYVMALLAAGVAVFLATHWAALPFLQRMMGLFFIGLIMHLWEEGRFPGGFVELIAEHLHFRARSRTFGEVVTAADVLVMTFVPLFFPDLAFLAVAAMMLGIMEAVMHTAMIRMFRLKHFYSPSLATAVFILLPISLVTLAYVGREHLLHPIWWPVAFLYMLFVLVLAQQIVIRASGVSYSDFLKNVRGALSGRGQ